MRGTLKADGRLAFAVVFSAAGLCAQQAALRVTVFDRATGEAVEGLAAEHFAVIDDKRPLRVESAKPAQGPLDVLLLVDASFLGEMTRPLAPAFIDGLGDGEQMALVSYRDSADLEQDFTADKPLLRRAAAAIRYGNAPRIADALFASLDGGFENSAGRRAVMLLSAGVEGRSRSSQVDVLSLAREKGVSIYAVFVEAADRGLFRALAMRSGGAYFHARQFQGAPEILSRLVFAAARSQYELTVNGARLIGSRVEVKVTRKSKRKLAASVLVVE